MSEVRGGGAIFRRFGGDSIGADRAEGASGGVEKIGERGGGRGRKGEGGRGREREEMGWVWVGLVAPLFLFVGTGCGFGGYPGRALGGST